MRTIVEGAKTPDFEEYLSTKLPTLERIVRSGDAAELRVRIKEQGNPSRRNFKIRLYLEGMEAVAKGNDRREAVDLALAALQRQLRDAKERRTQRRPRTADEKANRQAALAAEAGREAVAVA